MNELSGARLEAGICLGQSNAGFADGEPGGPLMPSYGPHGRVLMLAGKAGGSIGSEEADTFEERLVEYVEPEGRGQTPAAVMAFAAGKIDEYFGAKPQNIAVHTSFRGNVPLNDLFPGAAFNIHENALGALMAMRAAARADGSGLRLAWLDVIHGEGGPYSGYGPLFREYITEIVESFTLELEQYEAPAVIFSQVNSFTSAQTYNPVVLDQLSVGRELLGQRVYLAGPMYQCPFYDPGHLTDVGRMIHGEVRAMVRHFAITQNSGWNPLWPSSETLIRCGRVLTIPLQLPPGCQMLSWDEDWIPPVPNGGFVYRDNTGDEITISTVEIHDQNIIIVLQDEPYGESGTLEYAMHNGKDVFWWASGRGHLYADSGVPSIYASLGFQVPATIRYYCVSFAAPVLRSQAS